MDLEHGRHRDDVPHHRGDAEGAGDAGHRVGVREARGEPRGRRGGEGGKSAAAEGGRQGAHEEHRVLLPGRGLRLQHRGARVHRGQRHQLNVQR